MSRKTFRGSSSTWSCRHRGVCAALEERKCQSFLVETFAKHKRANPRTSSTWGSWSGDASDNCPGFRVVLQLEQPTATSQRMLSAAVEQTADDVGPDDWDDVRPDDRDNANIAIVVKPVPDFEEAAPYPNLVVLDFILDDPAETFKS